jgi:hypothetical protein
VAEVVKSASIGAGEVRVFMRLFYNAQEVCLRS